MKRTVPRYAATLAVLLVATSCTLGPEPKRPITAADGVEAYAHAGAETEADLPDAQPKPVMRRWPAKFCMILRPHQVPM